MAPDGLSNPSRPYRPPSPQLPMPAMAVIRLLSARLNCITAVRLGTTPGPICRPCASLRRDGSPQLISRAVWGCPPPWRGLRTQMASNSVQLGLSRSNTSRGSPPRTLSLTPLSASPSTHAHTRRRPASLAFLSRHRADIDFPAGGTLSDDVVVAPSPSPTLLPFYRVQLSHSSSQEMLPIPD